MSILSTIVFKICLIIAFVFCLSLHLYLRMGRFSSGTLVGQIDVRNGGQLIRITCLLVIGIQVYIFSTSI